MLGTLEEDLKKIEALEDSAEFQAKLQALRKKMLEIKRWSTAKYLALFFFTFTVSFCYAEKYDHLVYIDWWRSFCLLSKIP